MAGTALGQQATRKHDMEESASRQEFGQHSTRKYDSEESATQAEKMSRLAFGHHSTRMYDPAESAAREASGWPQLAYGHRAKIKYVADKSV